MMVVRWSFEVKARSRGQEKLGRAGGEVTRAESRVGSHPLRSAAAEDEKAEDRLARCQGLSRARSSEDGRIKWGGVAKDA